MNWIEELRRLLRGVTGEPPDADPPGGISCHEAAEVLFDWLDGELPPGLEKRVGTHLETCARCYPKLVFERSFLEAVARASRVSRVPPELRAQVIEALEAEGLAIT